MDTDRKRFRYSGVNRASVTRIYKVISLIIQFNTYMKVDRNRIAFICSLNMHEFNQLLYTMSCVCCLLP